MSWNIIEKKSGFSTNLRMLMLKEESHENQLLNITKGYTTSQLVDVMAINQWFSLRVGPVGAACKYPGANHN
jgi:hypothetical protein